MKTKNKQKVNIPVLLVTVIIAIALIVSIITVSVHKGRRQQEVYHFNKDIACGVDVSEHNGTIDWAELSRQQDFAIIRVGYRGYGGKGNLFKDKYVYDNLKGAEKSGIPFGVYFYTQAIDEKEAEEEADFVYDIIKKYNVTLPVFFDFEYPIDADGNAVGRVVEQHNDAKSNTKIINAFAKRLQKKGYITGIYASSYVYNTNIDMNKLDKDLVVWVADYNDSVTYSVDYTIWQYTERGSCPGVSSKYTDLNYWYKRG